MKKLTEKQLMQLTNIKAFNANFKELYYLYDTHDKKIYVYKEEPKYNISNYIQYGSLTYINGWLYGAVQAKYNIFNII